MYQFLSRKGQAIGVGVGVAISVLALLLIFMGISDFNALDPKDPNRYSTRIFDFGIYASIALTVLMVILTILFAFYHTYSDFKSSKKSLLSLGAVALAFVGLYATAPIDKAGRVGAAVAKFGLSNNLEKLIGGGIGLMFLLMFLMLAVLIFFEVRNAFK